MTTETDFTPKLGKIRSRGGKRGAKYVQRVMNVIGLAGPGSKRSRFSGSRIGRGAGIGRVLASRDTYAAYRERRVIIKSRIVRTKAKGGKGARLHLRYIQREGVTREGEPGQLYNAKLDRADGEAFLGRSQDDRHQFRFIVAAEDGDQYGDLKPFVRQLMGRMEADLGTKLDWVAVDHFNTGHPHTHIVMRGQDDRGKDLIIARDYMSHGMRERAAEIVSFDLGPRTNREIGMHLRREVEQERFTSHDRRLLNDVEGDGLVRPHKITDVFQQTLRTGRLEKLMRMGLAQHVAPGAWRLAGDLETTLREIGVRGDIIKTLHRELSSKGVSKAPADVAIYDPAGEGARELVGRVVSRGLSDELGDRHFLVVDGADGFSHYVDIGRGEDTEELAAGGIVAIRPKRIEPRAIDRTVAEIAARHGGRYSVDLHLRDDPRASIDFAETHVRRLEAIRRLTGSLDRERDGTWMIGPDHLEKTKVYEQRRALLAPVTVETLSAKGLDHQVTADGATWLDRQLTSKASVPLRDAGFGRETSDALARRRQWLLEQNLAREQEGRLVFRSNLVAALRRREVARIADQLAQELGLTYAEKSVGQMIEGIYRKPLDLTSGRFAMIESRGKQFSIVPWRLVLDRSLGKEVVGIVRASGISWTIGQNRGLSR